MTDEVIFQMLGGHPLPQYATPGAAAFDLRASLKDGMFILRAGERALISAGFHIQLPVGKELQIRPRSGLALNDGITVLNTPGTVDSDYRGEVRVILYNSSRKPFGISHGDRIAQGVIADAKQYTLKSGIVENDTDRGADGFGSTGVK